MSRTPEFWIFEPLRRYAQFSGRACRGEYWWFFLLGNAFNSIAATADNFIGLKSFGFGTIVALALFCPQLAVGIRRLHDIDRSGWWLGSGTLGVVVIATSLGLIYQFVGKNVGLSIIIGLAVLALIVWLIFLVVCFCTRGTAGPNRFGPDPLALDDSNVGTL